MSASRSERAPLVARKWRPTLQLIVIAVLLVVLALPVGIVIGFRALDHTTSRMGLIELGALLVALLLTVVIGLVFARTITGPIHALIRRADAIGNGGRAAIQPLERYGTHEIALLTQSFLDLADRLVRRTEYVNTFAAHLTHELKSPLTAVRGAAELLRDSEDPEAPMSRQQRVKFLDHIIADVERLDTLLARLRELARAEADTTPGVSTPAELVATLQRDFPGLTITLDGAADTPLAIRLEALVIAASQLAGNAQAASATTLGLSVQQRDAEVKLTFTDNGPGISPADTTRIFEPFFTTRREAGGTGMGLSIARAMAEAHGGTLDLQLATPGAVFVLTVPRAKQNPLPNGERAV